MIARGTPRPRAVLFDFDDTLLDSAAARLRAYKGLREQYAAINKVSSLDETLAFFVSFESSGLIDGERLGFAIMDRWPGVELDPTAFGDWLFTPVAEQVRPFNGVSEFLESLNRANVPWGAVTNGQARQVIKLHCSGLTDVVPFMIVSMIFGANKPDPLIYHEAVRRLKISFPGLDDLSHAEVLFVGDNPHTDITGAFGVGMRTAWIGSEDAYPADAPRPDMVIDSVLELHGLLGLD